MCCLPVSRCEAPSSPAFWADVRVQPRPGGRRGSDPPAAGGDGAGPGPPAGSESSSISLVLYKQNS